jgi:hypothetical protein
MKTLREMIEELRRELTVFKSHDDNEQIHNRARRLGVLIANRLRTILDETEGGRPTSWLPPGHGYQPTKSTTDPKNPPQGGSGVPTTEKEVMPDAPDRGPDVATEEQPGFDAQAAFDVLDRRVQILEASRSPEPSPQPDELVEKVAR